MNSMTDEPRRAKRRWFVARTTRVAIYERDKGRCAYCTKALILGDEEQYRHPMVMHLDHVRPLSQGGRTMKANLVACCPPCNRTKGEFAWTPDYSGIAHLFPCEVLA